MPARLLCLLGLALLFAACRDESGRVIQTDIAFQKEGTLTFLRADGTPVATIDVELAETPQERARGLMHRRSLPPSSGMLFLFDAPDTLSFWMHNTPLPLDILFVSPDSQIVTIVRRTTPFSDDHIRSTAPAQYVVEVRAGFADRAGLTEGMRIRWRRTP
ncbi:MAG: DUF192 domain-containing protein [Bacteroidetes bacterium]|nr:MAG: DUF192 domain-containing protein [Bacteroidota bacterium]